MSGSRSRRSSTPAASLSCPPVNIVWASCRASAPLAAAIFPCRSRASAAATAGPSSVMNCSASGRTFDDGASRTTRLVVVEGAATELAPLLRLPLLSVALTEVEQDLGQPRQRVGAFELRDRVGVFPQVVRGVSAPERRLCFIASRRRRVGGRRCRQRAPPPHRQPRQERQRNVNVTSAASAAAPTVVRRHSASPSLLHARAHSWNIRLRCSFTAAYRFRGKRPASGRCFTQSRGTDSDDEAQILLRRERARRRSHWPVVGIACADAAAAARASGAADPADAAVTFQSAVTNPATWNSLWGSWPRRPLRPRDGVRLRSANGS